MAVICNLICVLAMMLCTNTYSVFGDAAKYYIEDYCTPGSVDSEVFVGEEGVQLYSHKDQVYGRELDCRVTLYTNDGYNLTLRSQLIELKLGDCIRMYDGQYNNYSYTGGCTINPLAYTTTQKYLTIQFITDGFTHTTDKFRLLVTQQIPGQDIPCYSGSGDFQCLDRNGCFSESSRCGSYTLCADQTDNRNCDRCDDGAFLCESSHHCVATRVLCDGNQDCDNGEDETQPECFSLSDPSDLTGGQLAGIIIGLVIFLVIVIVIVAVVYRKYKK